MYKGASRGTNIATSFVSLVAGLPLLDQHVLDELLGWKDVCCYAAVIVFIQTLERAG